MKKFLSTPYFLSRDHTRQAELDLCLRKNVENASIDRIFLFIDDGHLPVINSEKIIIKLIEGRLTYRRWLEFVSSIPTPHIAILSNSDIYFDDSIGKMDDVLARRNRFVALSRVDKVEDGFEPHPKPQWSQDVWAFNSRSTITTALKKAADFQLGVPRCDNKIAFEFAMHGWDIINPFPAIRSIHVHESNIRGYHKEDDRTLIGGMGFVRPQENLSADSRVEITVWPLKTAGISHIRVVSALEDWSRASETTTDEGPLIVYNQDWQFPAITEQWAFERIRKFSGFIPEGCAYFAFPWATLIDRIQNRPATAEPLHAALRPLGEAAKQRERVVTVCQHIRLKEHQKLIADSGVTDVFWSHATKGEDCLPDYPHIRLHPFPLYPVQSKSEFGDVDRKHLFSFVGARAKDFYLTQSRNMIIDRLGGHPRGLVIARDDWHYNKVVYDHQIKKTVQDGEALIDDQASDDFRKALSESVFSLCPSGSGPNSIRLWESIGAGAIPVILADSYAPPGPEALWIEAAVFCPETEQAISFLPAELDAIAADKELLARKRHALRQLWALYGPKFFVSDILHCFIEHASMKALDSGGALPIGDTDLVNAAKGTDRTGLWGEGEFLLNAVASRMLVNAGAFANTWDGNSALRTRCESLAEQMAKRPIAAAFAAAKSNLEQDKKRRPASYGRKPRIFLLGRNVTRTPLFYDGYKALFRDRLDYVSHAHEADIILVGASPNITEHSDEIYDALTRKPSIKIAALSEEPLWDTTWTFDTFSNEKYVTLFERKFKYTVFNHFTSQVFDFERLPYFVTTDDRFFVRYARQFDRNAGMTTAQLLETWKSAKWRAAFFAERRHGDIYDFRTAERDLYGLCAYRTRLAEKFEGGQFLHVGKGWRPAERRQDLPDWHLDKLVTLDKRAFIISGLENTHFATYITEKLFDAYAALGVPIYYASDRHRIKLIVNDWSFINVFGKSADDAHDMIASFEPDAAFADAYLAAQRQLRSLFSDQRTLITERRRVVDEVLKSLAVLIESEDCPLGTSFSDAKLS